MTLVSDLAIVAQKWSEVAAGKKLICWSSPLMVDGSRSRSAAASYVYSEGIIKVPMVILYYSGRLYSHSNYCFFPFLDTTVLLSLTTFPFILNILKSLRIAFIQKVETF